MEIFCDHSYLDNIHLGMLKELGEDRHGVTLEDGICLDVGPRHNVAQGPETRGHHLQLSAVKKPHQVGDHAGINNFLEILAFC